MVFSKDWHPRLPMRDWALPHFSDSVGREWVLLPSVLGRWEDGGPTVLNESDCLE